MRHIPSEDTRSIGNIGFDNALKKALGPSEQYDSAKWLFVPNNYTEYRYILGTRGQNPLICVGVNPSTALPDRLDPTLKSVERIASSNGYDSFLMINVYAQRATAPESMDRACHAELHRENLNAFRYALTLSGTGAVWAAWGNIIEMRPWLIDCAADMIDLSREYGAKWLCCGPISKRGHPHHPLYLKKGEPLVPFDAQAYAERLRSRSKQINTI